MRLGRLTFDVDLSLGGFEDRIDAIRLGPVDDHGAAFGQRNGLRDQPARQFAAAGQGHVNHICRFGRRVGHCGAVVRQHIKGRFEVLLNGHTGRRYPHQINVSGRFEQHNRGVV